MLQMLTLDVLKQDQQRLRLVGWQAAPPQASDQGELFGEAPGADRDVALGLIELDQNFAHAWITAGWPGSGGVPSARIEE